jgi:hypothetical protein
VWRSWTGELVPSEETFSASGEHARMPFVLFSTFSGLQPHTVLAASTKRLLIRPEK